MFDKIYKSLLKKILEEGYQYNDPNRKDTYRKEIFHTEISYLYEKYPSLYCKKTFFKPAVGELLVFLQGKTDVRDYWKYNVNFWDKDVFRFNRLTEEEFIVARKEVLPSSKYNTGKIYPYQYAKQYHVFDNFKANPLRTDLIINSWNIHDLKEMCLIPCHYSFQLLGSNESFAIVWNQRSTDALLGTPMNIQFYYLMGKILEWWSGYKFSGVIANLNKVHLYDNQIEFAKKIVEVEDIESNSILELNIPMYLKTHSFEDFIKNLHPNMFKLENYEYLLSEKIEMKTYTN